MVGGIARHADKRVAGKPLWALAREHTQEALGSIVWLLRNAENEGVRLQAADKLLDRAWGKAPIIVAGDETRPITVDVRTIDSDRLAHLEQALMLALGEGIANAALPHAETLPSAETLSPSPPLYAEGDASRGIGSYQGDAPTPCAGSTKGQRNENESLTSLSSPFVLDNGALQHGDGGEVTGASRDGEGDA